jgi:carbonic anhydrase/acetyltransferase-like protein (isoleucine patch superfamily)
MRCYLNETGTRLEPFLDPVGQSPIANRSLLDWQRRVAKASGLELVEDGGEPVGPCLLWSDDLFVTHGLMKAFLEALDSAPEDRVCALRVEGSVQLGQSGALQDVPIEPGSDGSADGSFPLWYLPPGTRGPPPEPGSCHPVVVRPKEKIVRVPVPEHWFGEPELVLPLTKQVALRLGHWSHLLAVNRLAWALDWLELPRWRLGWLGLGVLIRAVIPTRARLLRAASRIGKGCEIHPTAVIEGSILEPGVRVGPFAVVRFSRVGQGSWIQDHGKLTLSVLGERSLVSAGSTVNLCLGHDQASFSQILMQLSVLGRRSITTGGGFLMDMRFDGEVRVLHQGRPQGIGSRFLGSAIGHDAVLGTGFWIAPGRSIPNGAVVVRDPAQVVRRVPERVEPGTVLVPRDGALVPLAAETPAGDEPEG